MKKKKSPHELKKKPPLSIEEQEIELRNERAKKTSFSITLLEKKYFPFANYEVIGSTNICYHVEIRSLQEKINSCSCPDFQISSLGHCKHIEGVLLSIKNDIRHKFNVFAAEGSKRTEMFLDPKCESVRIYWPHKNSHLNKIRQLIEPYISSNQSLLEDIAGVTAMQNAVQNAPKEIADHIRISQNLLDWVEEKQRAQERERDRELFLADVMSGKRSLQMLTAKLLPYQEEGMLHLAFKGKAILADEMGLGKTIQAIAACELLRRLSRVKKVLIVAPASLKGEWEEQIARFIGHSTLIINGSRADRLASYKKEAFFYILNYEQIRSDFIEIQELINPDILILDEAQRVKNWTTKTAWAVKQLKVNYAFVLTGTPIENRIEELFSIMQVVDPKILGPLFKFQQKYFNFNDKNKPFEYRNLNDLHAQARSVLMRRLKKDVEEQLPERIISSFFVEMTQEQKKRYDEYSTLVARLLIILRRRPFTVEESKKLMKFLACMRMIADTPYILDDKCKDCPKLDELEDLLPGLIENRENKIIIFSEWERMLQLVRDLADRLGLNYAWHTGTVPQAKRREDIKRFKEDPDCRLFLSTDSGSTGLNLQVANVVINLDLPWNPAKLDQRISRAWRKNQTRVVQVINLITENSIEQRMLNILSKKRAVANAVLDGEGDLDDMSCSFSSREDLIEKLEQLMGNKIELLNDDESKKVPPRIVEKPAIMTHRQFRDEVIARHGDRLHLLEKHDGILLAVVDKVDPSIQQSFCMISQDNVELLDLETYAVLQRLAAAGIIQFNPKYQNRLFESQLIQANRNLYQRSKHDEALTHYKEGERKFKMAVLLKSGGFVEEALLPAKEAYQKATEALKVIDCQVSDRMSLPNDQESDQLINALTSWMENVSEKLAQYALGIQT